MTLYMFYGEECPHCENMMPKVDQLEEETDIEVERLETWHDKENAEKLEEFDKDEDGEKLCGGVPFFYNTETNEWICGETSQENLEDWAGA